MCRSSTTDGNAWRRRRQRTNDIYLPPMLGTEPIPNLYSCRNEHLGIVPAGASVPCTCAIKLSPLLSLLCLLMSSWTGVDGPHPVILILHYPHCILSMLTIPTLLLFVFLWLFAVAGTFIHTL
ncbi:hypothetical protein BDW69DRAFT_147727 [Aspergillus filifer]